MIVRFRLTALAGYAAVTGDLAGARRGSLASVLRAVPCQSRSYLLAVSGFSTH